MKDQVITLPEMIDSDAQLDDEDLETVAGGAVACSCCCCCCTWNEFDEVQVA